MDESNASQLDAQIDDVDLLLERVRDTVTECQRRADVLQFLADEVEGKAIIERMQHEARVLSMVGEVAPKRRREAELLMGECARVWTGIATARPWAWR